MYKDTNERDRQGGDSMILAFGKFSKHLQSKKASPYQIYDWADCFLSSTQLPAMGGN